jgi:tetratricopeptide (TPR) repeat protein
VACGGIRSGSGHIGTRLAGCLAGVALQVLVDLGDGDRSLSHGRGHPLHRAGTYVAGGEHSRQAGFQRKRYRPTRPGRPPLGRSRPVRMNPCRSRLTAAGSQPVCGAAPIMTNSAAAGTVSWRPVRRSRGTSSVSLRSPRAAATSQRNIGFRPGEACTWDTLGYIHHNLDQYAEAISCYGRALRLQRQPDDKYEQAGTLGRMGDTYAASGSTAMARGCWYQALAILEELHDPDAQQLRAKLNGTGRS